MNWAIFLNTSKITIYQRFIGEIRFGPVYLELKSEPEIEELNDKIFGDWFFRTQNGVFLQQWNSINEANTNLIYLNFHKLELKTICENIKSVFWEMREVSDNVILNTNINFKIIKIDMKAIE